MFIGLCIKEVHSSGLTMLPPRARDHITKSPTSGIRSPLFSFGQGCTKDSQNVTSYWYSSQLFPPQPPDVKDKSPLLKTPALRMQALRHLSWHIFLNSMCSQHIKFALSLRWNFGLCILELIPELWDSLYGLITFCLWEEDDIEEARARLLWFECGLFFLKLIGIYSSLSGTKR